MLVDRLLLENSVKLQSFRVPDKCISCQPEIGRALLFALSCPIVRANLVKNKISGLCIQFNVILEKVSLLANPFGSGLVWLRVCCCVLSFVQAVRCTGVGYSCEPTTYPQISPEKPVSGLGRC